MYTYIYTEKSMEFYKEGRVLTLATGTTLDLSAAQYNHKAVLIVSEAPAGGDTISIKFYTKGVKSAAVLFAAAPYADASPANAPSAPPPLLGKNCDDAGLATEESKLISAGGSIFPLSPPSSTP